MMAALSALPVNVALRRDFEGLASYDRIGRILRRMVDEGLLIRIGYGLYAKTCIGPMSKRMIPVNCVNSLAKEALGRRLRHLRKALRALRAGSGGEKIREVGRVVNVRDVVRRLIEQALREDELRAVSKSV
jgi:hypothetical protein